MARAVALQAIGQGFESPYLQVMLKGLGPACTDGEPAAWRFFENSRDGMQPLWRMMPGDGAGFF